jgi:hypothetical protein
MWLIYKLAVEGEYTYGKGADADKVMFANPEMFRDSKIQWEQLVHKWCIEKI